MPKKATRRARSAKQSETGSPAPRKARRAPARANGTPRPAKAARAKDGLPRQRPDYAITLAASKDRIEFRPSADLARLAMRWSYRLRNRLRWKDNAESRRLLADESLQTLEALGVGRERLLAIAKAPLIEVTIPWKGESRWEARIFPWEFVIASATRGLGRTGQLTVVRHLDCGRPRSRPAAPLGPKGPSVLFVESVPGVLRDEYDFSSERRMVRSSLAPAQFEICKDPTPDELRSKVKSMSPDLIHLAGFDTHQTYALLSEADRKALPGHDGEPSRAFERDGYVLSIGRKPVVVPAEDLPALLTAGSKPPLFIGCNFYDSALRVAGLLVSGGAAGAVGFRDLQDDALMELFFARFYRAWRAGQADALAGFQAAWDAVSSQPRDVRGTSVVLWSDAPLIGRESKAGRVSKEVAEHDRMILTPPRAGIDDWAKVEVVPKERINYSLLHNQRSLFDRFLIHKYKPGRMTDVSVEVELMVGSERLGYRSTFDVTTSPHDLSRDVRIPLAWSLARELHEKVRTTLFVDVRWQDRVLKRDTLHVILLPVSEWHDTPEDDPWLPSFVLPRDPAVLRIVAAAQRYLVALDDDPGAGFDGYQSYDASDHGAAVDRRVQALWHALTQDLVLGYIDPPPVYSSESQRLRTPSEVLNGARGTCIDLALLFASCLEFVDICPVLFLLDDHAFPGYWRDPEAHDAFAELRDDAATPGAEATRLGQTEAWSLGKDNFDEIRQLVHSGKLVPLETVDLTARTSFRQACDDVLEHFTAGSRKNFSSMLDVSIARDHYVTPLPFPEGPVLETRI